MSAWLIVDTAIENPEAYEDYKAAARPIAERFGGVYRVRGGAMTVIQDELWTPTRLVVIEFPSTEAARAFLDSPDYAPIRAVRLASARTTMALVEGL